MNLRKTLAVWAAWTSAVSQLLAQEPVIEQPNVPGIVRPYVGSASPPVPLKNSRRLYGLIRAGKLYLTLQDAIALAIENNLDLEIYRYGPLNAEWALERTKGGGPLKGVTGVSSINSQITPGLGVGGSEVSAGLSNNNGNGGNGSTGGVTVSQIGPITPNLDPVLQSAMNFQHQSQPQSNLVVSQTTALVDTIHTYVNTASQGLLTGGIVQAIFDEQYLKQNAPTNILNPAVSPFGQIFIRHNFLYGFGTAVNSRFIHVAEKNRELADETVRSQLLNLVASVVNLYWDLVGDIDDLKVRQQSLDLAQKFYEDTKKEIAVGVTARVEVFRAEGEVKTRQRELAISQSTVLQQETLLKNALSRNGLEDPVLEAAAVVPLDHIEVPKNDELPPLRELIANALAKRPDMVMSKISDEASEISALGTSNGLLPILGTRDFFSAQGLAGTPTSQSAGQGASPYYTGGFGKAAAQLFRHNFPSYRGDLYLVGTFRNRTAQADYGIDQLAIKQGDLIERRNQNQLALDVSNYLIALRQARARYNAAVDTRTLQDQLLQKEERKFSLGGSTRAEVITAQRSLATARLAEVAALVNYSHARVSLDQVLGETLEKNHVLLGEALTGKVSHVSELPKELETTR